MTVATTTSKIQYNTNGSATEFAYDFKIASDSELVVYLTEIADESNEETLVLNTDYTVAGAGDESGGSITTASTYATGYRLTIARSVNQLQVTDLTSQGSFFPEVHEDAFDKLTMMVQDLTTLLATKVGLSITSDSDPEDYLTTVVGYVSSASTYASAASSSASDAASSASDAASSASDAAASAAEAAASAAEAEASVSSLDLPTLVAGNAYQMLRVKSDSSGYEVTDSLTLKENDSIPTPPTSKLYIYAKTDGKLYVKDDTGTETEVGSGSGGTSSWSTATSKTADYQLLGSDDGNLVYLDATATADKTFTLKASPSDQDVVWIGNENASYRLTISDGTDDIIYLFEDETFKFTYSSDFSKWFISTV